ncbi:MAG: hypothetical protein AVDCRST_MAG19-4981, partial [uncultured Thermomicrobiales bacterium]
GHGGDGFAAGGWDLSGESSVGRRPRRAGGVAVGRRAIGGGRHDGAAGGHGPVRRAGGGARPAGDGGQHARRLGPRLGQRGLPRRQGCRPPSLPGADAGRRGAGAAGTGAGGTSGGVRERGAGAAGQHLRGGDDAPPRRVDAGAAPHARAHRRLPGRLRAGAAPAAGGGLRRGPLPPARLRPARLLGTGSPLLGPPGPEDRRSLAWGDQRAGAAAGERGVPGGAVERFTRAGGGADLLRRSSHRERGGGAAAAGKV